MALREKLPEKFILNLLFNFFASVVRFSSFWKNELIGMGHNLIFSIHSVPNKFSVFFNTNVFSFNVLPWKVTFVISSLSNLIFFFVKDLAILLDLSKVGFPNFSQVCRFMIAE